MKTLTTLLILVIGGFTHAQVYVDPAVAAAQTTHAAVINTQLENTNERLTLIERGQLAVTGNLTQPEAVRKVGQPLISCFFSPKLVFWSSTKKQLCPS